MSSFCPAKQKLICQRAQDPSGNRKSRDGPARRPSGNPSLPAHLRRSSPGQRRRLRAGERSDSRFGPRPPRPPRPDAGPQTRPGPPPAARSLEARSRPGRQRDGPARGLQVAQGGAGLAAGALPAEAAAGKGLFRLAVTYRRLIVPRRLSPARALTSRTRQPRASLCSRA